MVKGFSDNEVKNDAEIKESKKEKKGLAAFITLSHSSSLLIFNPYSPLHMTIIIPMNLEVVYSYFYFRLNE